MDDVVLFTTKGALIVIDKKGRICVTYKATDPKASNAVFLYDKEYVN